MPTPTPTPLTITAELALLLGSALLVMVTVCEPLADGAVYSPLVVIVPVLAAPPNTPSTYHLTPVLVVPVTMAANCFVAFPATVTEVGLMLIVMTVTVTAELALLVGSALLVMVTVCEPLADGAV
jgi:hypothetical protein